MTRKCKQVRERLVELAGKASPELVSHLARCAECERFASRLDGVRAVLRRHHANVEPDAGFAARVTARLVRDAAGDLGWTAARLLPATLVLLGLMAWIAFQTPLPAVESDSEDLLSWVVADSNGGAP